MDDYCDYQFHCDGGGGTAGIVIGIAFAHLIPPWIYSCFADVSDDASSYVRCVSMFWYIFFFPWLIVLIVFHVFLNDPPRTFVHLLSIVFSSFMYVGVLLESLCFSHEEEYLSTQEYSSSEDETAEYIDMLRETKPVMATHVDCYHRETRFTQRSHHNVTTYITEVTWRGMDKYEIPYWWDTSDATPTFNTTRATRLTVPDIVHFNNDESRRHYVELRDAFVNANRHRDKSIRFHTTLEIPGHTKKRMMVCGRNYVQPWWVSLGWYYLVSFLHMMWPCRWFLRSQTEKAECYIVKEISCQPRIIPHPIQHNPETQYWMPGQNTVHPEASAPPPAYTSVQSMGGRYINSDLMISSLPSLSDENDDISFPNEAYFY